MEESTWTGSPACWVRVCSRVRRIASEGVNQSAETVSFPSEEAIGSEIMASDDSVGTETVGGTMERKKCVSKRLFILRGVLVKRSVSGWTWSERGKQVDSHPVCTVL